MADYLASLPLGKLLPPGRHGLPGAPGIRLKTISADACTLVAGRNLPEVIAKAREALSVGLTDGPRRSAGAGIDFIGIGPGRWLAVAPETGLAQRLEAALAPAASIFEQGGGLVLLEAEGAAIESVLAKLAPLDLHPDVFPVGAAATTTAAHVNMTFWRCDGGTWRFAVGRSYLAACLRLFSCAAAEFGLDWTG
jgi:methylglutamate dehydrogenase subunit D